MVGFDAIAGQFYTAGLKYSAAIQPYALKLFVGLLLLDVVVTSIQFLAEGQLDSSYLLGRLIKHMLSGGFVYLMIVNAFPWMNAILKSFSTIGASISGLPALSPQTVLQVGGQIAGIIFSVPATASLTTDLELAIAQTVSAFVVLLAFVVTAAMLLLTLVESYLVVGGGVILLGFGANRFTAPAAEGYFGYVLRVGVRLLFFYLVLAVGVQMANQWAAALTAACKPVPTTLPWYTTYGAPPSAIITSVCSASVPVSVMLNYVAGSVVFMIVSLAVPYTAASIASGTIGLALSHAFEAAYIAQTVVQPLRNVMQTGFGKVAQAIRHDANENSPRGAWLRSVELSQHDRRTTPLQPAPPPRVPAPKNPRATSVPAPVAQTTVLNPSTRAVSNPNANGTKAIGKSTTIV